VTTFSQKEITGLLLDWGAGEREALDRRSVELRYFGGLNLEQTAEILGISSPTVQREWRAANAWLYRAISEGIPDEPPTL